jgi:excisionase family DNA binding protein
MPQESWHKMGRRTKSVVNKNSFMTFPEVQSYLGIRSRKTILKYIRTGILPAYKLGGTRWRIALEDVRVFLKKQLAGNGSG